MCWDESTASPKHCNTEWKHAEKLEIYSKLPAFTPWRVTLLPPVQQRWIIWLSVHMQNPIGSWCKHKIPHVFSSMSNHAQIHVHCQKKTLEKEIVILNLNQKFIHLFHISNLPSCNCPYSWGEELSNVIIPYFMDKVWFSSMVLTENSKRCWGKKDKCNIMKTLTYGTAKKDFHN